MTEPTYKGLRGATGYYGGKQKIASWILEQLYRIQHSVYTEPFCGGAAVMFAKGLPAVKNKQLYKEAINDSSRVLTNMYKVLRDSPEEFHRRLELTLYSQDETAWANSVIKAGTHDDPIELARALYVAITQGFANQVGSWGTSTTRCPSQAYTNAVDRLPQVTDRLRRVHIGCEDALAFIKRWDSPQTLHYVDPPYPAKDGVCKDYKKLNAGAVYTIDDLKRLVDVLSNAKGSFILSNYPQDIEVPSDWVRKEKQTTEMTSGNYGARTEVIWLCDRSANITNAKEVNLAAEVYTAFNAS